MMNLPSKFLLFFTFFVSFSTLSQEKLDRNVRENKDRVLLSEGKLDTKSTKVALSGNTKYTDYKIFFQNNDTVFVDTTLTIEKEYKFNFLRKDNFELLAFHNQGQTFNNLAYSFGDATRFPDIGFLAKQFNYIDANEIKYFEVPTPTTEILYRDGLEQGQVLNTIFTLNFSRRLNASIAYKGIRSLGAYRRALASHGNFRTTFNYRTKNDQYQVRGHISTQDFLNQQNGGLPKTMVTNFINDDDSFKNRGRFDVNLVDAENQFDGNRVYLEHSYKLISNKDSLKNKDFSNLKVGHVLTTEKKLYNFTQKTNTSEIFGTVNATNYENSQVQNNIISNEFNLEFNSKYVLGKIKAKIDITNFIYGYDSILNSKANLQKYKLEGNALTFGANWSAKIKNFKLNAEASLTPIGGILSGSLLKGEVLYEKDSVFSIKGSLLIGSKSPNFNMLLHQSKYDAYNWDNTFSNVNTRDLGFSLKSKWLNVDLNFTNIDNFTYFDQKSTPQQYNNQVIYLKVKANKEFKVGKFALNNTLMYQKVSNGSDVFKVPEFVTRNTLYYTDYWFKGKPLMVQIGTTFKYFTEYKANAYHPLLAEFTLQNTTDIGFPTVDVFFNAQIRRTRIFFKIENVTSDFGPKNYFSAPNYPYRDFTIRFGLVWNWFI